jgi:hypothetical protein
MQRIYPSKRKKGWVLIQYTGYKISGTASRLWPGALTAPRKPIVFESYLAASDYRKEKQAKEIDR